MAQITVTLDLTPENLAAVQKLMTALKNPSGEMEQVKLDDTDAQPAEPSVKPKSAARKDTKADKAPEAQKTEKSPETQTGQTLGDAKKMTEPRAIALKLSQAGKQSTLQAIFTKFGAKKLSDVKLDDYDALMTELQAAAGAKQSKTEAADDEETIPF